MCWDCAECGMVCRLRVSGAPPPPTPVSARHHKAPVGLTQALEAPCQIGSASGYHTWILEMRLISRRGARLSGTLSFHSL